MPGPYSSISSYLSHEETFMGMILGRNDDRAVPPGPQRARETGENENGTDSCSILALDVSSAVLRASSHAHSADPRPRGLDSDDDRERAAPIACGQSFCWRRA